MGGRVVVGAARTGIAAFLLSVAALSMFCLAPATGLQSFSGRTFGAYPCFNSSNANLNIVMNWSSGANVTVEAYSNNIVFNISNESTRIYGLYWQNTSYSLNQYSGFGNANYTLCLGSSGYGGMSIMAENNVTVDRMSNNITNVSGSGVNSTLFNLSHYVFCPPGKYYGNFSVIDAYNASERVNLTATIDIPASTQNVVNSTSWNYSGLIRGIMPLNSTYYHSYHFNLTELLNVTSLTLNISGISQTVGMFLFYGNGTPLAQCENSTGCEINTRIYNASPFLQRSDEMLELRVYGNLSSGSAQPYMISMHYSTLNATNDTGDQTGVLDFGNLNPKSTSPGTNFTLSNMGGRNITGVYQSSDFYWVKRWLNRSDNQVTNGTGSNMSFAVPNFTAKIEVTVEWRNTTSSANLTDWNLFLSNPGGRIVAESTSAFLNSNLTNAVVTERVVFSGNVFNETNAGFWNIIVNETHFPYSNISVYNVTVRLWLNTSSWVSTNFTQSAPLNTSGYGNTIYVTANVTAPQTSMLNGTYEGWIKYSNAGSEGAGWRFVLPLAFQVNAPMLVVNNSIYNTTIRIVENTGFFRKRSVNVTVSNPGGSPFIYYMTNSSNLTLGPRYINFTIDTYRQINSSGHLNANENRSINITLDINTSSTGNTEGIYSGWIMFNVTQNSTNNISIHNIFLVSLEVNLTSLLVVNITEYMGFYGSHDPFVSVNATNSSNITMLINVSLYNGSVLSNNNYLMNNSNFTSVTMNENNITAYSVTLTNITDGRTVPCDSAGFCIINATVPANIPGGRYNLHATAVWNTTSSDAAASRVLSGTGSHYPVTVWASGLYLSASNSTSISMGEYIDASFNVTITNYGPKTADSGIIYMNNSCSYVVVNASASGNVNGTCSLSATTSNNYFTVSSMPGNGTSCWVTFKVHSVNVSGSKSCDSSAGINVLTSVPSFNNITGITVSIGDTDGGSGGTSTNTGSSGSTTAYTYNRTVRIMSYNSAYAAKLGENISASVTVSNAGNTTSTVLLSATTNNSEIKISVSPASANLTRDSSATFTVYMNVTNASKLGLFSGTFKAYAEGYADVWYESKSFDFTVEATPTRKAEINLSYLNYTAQLDNLSAVFKAIKAGGLVDAANISRMEALFNDTSSIVDKIKQAINESNYAAAEALIAQLSTSINRIRDELSGLQAAEAAGGQKAFNDMLTWAVIGVIIAGAAGVVIYMLLPPKRGFRVPGGLKLPRARKKLFSRKEKGSLRVSPSKRPSSIDDYAELSGNRLEYLTAKYAEGYERALSQKGSLGARMKSLLRRKHSSAQERVSDFISIKKKVTS